MRVSAWSIALGCAAWTALCAHAYAQDAAWRPFLAVTPVYQDEGDLDNGGDFSADGVLTNFGLSGPIGGDNRAGITFNFDYLDYSFGNPVGFGGVAPWNVVQRYGLSVPLSFGLRENWMLGIVPSVNWFKEDGADTGDSLAWGGIVFASKRFASGNMIGPGIGVYELIEETRVFPLLLIDWRLGERWRLINPLSAGPIGPAGLELDYDFTKGWVAGFGGAFRRSRFRLSDTGPEPNGIGEQRDLPLFVRVTHNLGRQAQLHLYIGALVDGRLRVENPSGAELHEEAFDPAPFVGLTLQAHF